MNKKEVSEIKSLFKEREEKEGGEGREEGGEGRVRGRVT